VQVLGLVQQALLLLRYSLYPVVVVLVIRVVVQVGVVVQVE
jgi:hypothetical protein